MDDILPFSYANRHGVHMSLFALVLSSFVSTASAKDLAPGELPLTQVGAVADLKVCGGRVLANLWSATATAKAVITAADAERICAEAKGDLEIAQARAQAIKAGGDAEAGLVQAAAIPVMNGESVSYDRTVEPDGTIRTRLASGPAATVHELAAVAAALPQPAGFADRYGYGYNTEAGMVGLARLSGIPLGTTTPFMTGTSSATASCGTAEQCEAKVKALQSALAKK